VNLGTIAELGAVEQSLAGPTTNDVSHQKTITSKNNITLLNLVLNLILVLILPLIFLG
jgi:hypothetical protein